MVYVGAVLLFLVAIMAYLSIIVMRAVSLFTAKKTLKRVVGILIPLVILVGGSAMFGFIVAVALFYIAGIGLVFQLLFTALKKWLPGFFGKLYLSGIVPVVITAVVLVAGYFNMIDIERTEYNIESTKLSEDMKIVFLSDIHLCTTMDAEGFGKLTKRIEAEKPDAVIIGGDWFDNSTDYASKVAAAEAIGNVKAKYGVYYIYGNHDILPAEERVFSENGVTVLSDEIVSFGDVELIGRIDYAFSYTGDARTPLEKLVSEADSSKFIINADHQPRELEKAAALGVDLEVSGHTHAGQIFPFRQFCELIKANEMTYGLKKIGDFTAMTSSGAGGWGFPVRTQGDSEFVVINIKAAAK